MGYKRIVKLKTKIQRRDERIAQLELSKKRMQVKVHHVDSELAANQMLIKDKDEKIDLLYKEIGDMGARIAENTNSFTKNGVARIQQMIADLDTAIHGKTVARDASPQEVWNDLLDKVRKSRDAHLDRVTELETGGRAARDSLKAKITEHRVKSDVLREMVERLERQVEHLETDRDQVVKQRDEHREAHANLKQENERLHQVIGDLDIYKGKLKKERDKFAAEAIDLKNTVIQRDAEIKKVEIECYRLVQANSKLKQDLEYAEVQLKQHEEDAANRSAASLEIEITKALNYWGADNDLNTPDFILANHLYRHLMDLKRMLEATAKWRGTP